MRFLTDSTQVPGREPPPPRTQADDALQVVQCDRYDLHDAPRTPAFSEKHVRGPRLYCILPTFHRPRGLRITLTAILTQTHLPWHVFVVDNAPNRQNRLEVEAHHKRHGVPLTYVSTHENVGPAGAMALAMKLVLQCADDDDWIVRADDDMPPPRDLFAQTLAFGVGTRERDSRVAGVGIAGARFCWERVRLLRIPDADLTEAVSVDYLATGYYPLFLVRAVRECGVFDPLLFFGATEVEYGLRLREGGWTLLIDGVTLLSMRRAKGKLGVKPSARSALSVYDWRRYYSLRNLLYILLSRGRRWSALKVALTRGLLKPVVWLPRMPRRACTHLMYNVRAVADALSGRMGRTIEPWGYEGQSRQGSTQSGQIAEVVQ